MYKSRRNLLIAELLAGWVGMSIGLAVSFPRSPITMQLKSTGNAWVWLYFFVCCGWLMIVAAVIEMFYRSREMAPCRPFRRLACIRESAHVMLSVAWLCAVFIVWDFEKPPMTILLQGPVFILFHVYGAWENVKARVLTGERVYRTVLDLARGRRSV